MIYSFCIFTHHLARMSYILAFEKEVQELLMARKEAVHRLIECRAKRHNAVLSETCVVNALFKQHSLCCFLLTLSTRHDIFLSLTPWHELNLPLRGIFFRSFPFPSGAVST